jgi:hypothetical protein
MAEALAEHEQWYAEVIARVRERVAESVPAGARVAVVSKGDDALLQLGERTAWHFPQTETGLYTGHHPRDGADALAHLQRVIAKGADYLVIPPSARWWLDHYGELRAHLEEHGALVADDPLIYALRTQATAPDGHADLEAAQVGPAISAWLDALLPPDAGVVAIGIAPTGRPVWPLADASGLDAAAAAGFRYVVAAPPADLPGRRIATQTLAALYELSPRPPRRGLRGLFRHNDRRPDA